MKRSRWMRVCVCMGMEGRVKDKASVKDSKPIILLVCLP